MAINAYGYIRFGEKKWLEKNKYGEISFSCPGKFVNDEMTTGNQSRGDSMEAIFARLPESDRRIEKYKEKLGTDLDILPDKEGYVFLRRKSSLLTPIFCMFCITDKDFELVSQTAEYVKLQFTFPEEMYKGFSDNEKNCSIFTQASDFDNSIKEFFNRKKIKYRMQMVDYCEKDKKEFFIEPDDSRNELFYKRGIYKGQNEARIILPQLKMKSACERKTYNLGINPNSMHLFNTPTKMVLEGRK